MESKLNSPDKYGNDSLHTAVIRYDVKLLEHLLSQSHLDINYRNYKGETPLLLSLRMSHTNSFVTKLIQAGCDVNVTNKFGQTCLHIALLYSSIDVLLTLIQNGADVNVQDYEKRTPLHYAVENDNLEAQFQTDIAEILFPYYDEFSDVGFFKGCNALHLAASVRSTLAYDLVNAGIDVNSLTFDDISAILLSLDYEKSDLFKLIWPKLNHETLLQGKEPFLLKFIESVPFTWEDWVECMYLILESPIAFDLIDHCHSYYPYKKIKNDLISKLLLAFYWSDVVVQDRIMIIYICFSLGCTINISDINFANVLYGFNEELEAFLYAGDFNPRPFIFYTYFNLFPQQAFIFSLKDPSQGLVVDLFKKQIHTVYYYVDKLFPVQTNNIVNTLSFFSIPVGGKQVILNYSVKHLKEYKLIAEKLKEVPEVPTLVELSRNQARIYIQNRYCFRKPYEFYDVVKKLNLPQSLKDVVTFKTPLYL